MQSRQLYDRYGRLYDPDADIIDVPSLERAALHGSSSFLLNTRGAPGVGPSWQGDRPSVYQNLPLDADTLLRWLGGGVYPAGFGIANVLAIYGCDTASPLVDSLGLGPNLVAAGGPLTGRECVGLGQAGSWTSKVGCETTGGVERFTDAGTAFGDVADGTYRSFIVVLRMRPLTGFYPRLFGKEFGGGGLNARWEFLVDNPNPRPTLMLQTSLTAAYYPAQILANLDDGAWHCFGIMLDGVAKTGALYSDLGDNGPGGAYAGSLVSAATSFGLGSTVAGPTNIGFQTAYLACFDRAITSAMRAAFWRHAQVPVPFLHARLNPLVCPISASRVACYSGGNVGQAAVGYDASLVSAALGNPLGSGYVADAGETFEPIGSTDFYGNTAVGWPGSSRTSVDGPSGMRDGVRSMIGAAWNPAAGQMALFGPAAGVVIAGASNVPWRYDVSYRRAAVNTTCRAGLMFQNDPGGTEWFTLVTDNATPVDWTRNGGTCTPVGAAHTRVWQILGSAAALDDCDFGEPAVVKNRATAPLAWRRVGTAAAAVTTTPTVQVVNTNNYVYNPLRGEYRRTFAGFPGTAGAVLFQFGAAGAAGSMTADYNAGQLRWRGWNSAGALAWTVLCGAIGTGKYQLVFQWDSVSPLRTIGGAYVAVTDVNPALPVILGTWLAPWTAQPAAVTPLYLLTDAAGANPWRGFHEEA